MFQSVTVLTKLGRELARQTGREEGESVRHLFQRLSILLMKGNASLILSRTPAFSDQEVDGDIDQYDDVWQHLLLYLILYLI